MKKNPTKYLIAAQPEGIKSLYYNDNGEKVEIQFAKDFFSHGDAKEFATMHNIDLNKATNYIVIK
jgi:hypothetical protein